MWTGDQPEVFSALTRLMGNKQTPNRITISDCSKRYAEKHKVLWEEEPSACVRLDGKLRQSRTRRFWSSEEALPGWRWRKEGPLGVMCTVVGVSHSHYRTGWWAWGRQELDAPRVEAAGFILLRAQAVHSQQSQCL